MESLSNRNEDQMKREAHYVEMPLKHGSRGERSSVSLQSGTSIFPCPRYDVYYVKQVGNMLPLSQLQLY